MSDTDIRIIKAICNRVSIEDKQEILRIILSTTSMEIREDDFSEGVQIHGLNIEVGELDSTEGIGLIITGKFI